MREQISLLGVTYVSLLMIMCFKGINTTACTDRTTTDNFSPVTPMCKSGTVRNTRVVIDTWGTGGPDVHNCTCTVTLDTGSAAATVTTTVIVQEYPDTSPVAFCGSELQITSTTSSISCTAIRATSVYSFGRASNLTLTLLRTDANVPWKYGHCILISQDLTSYEIIVTCHGPQGAPSIDVTTTAPTTIKTTPKTTTTTTTTTTLESTSAGEQTGTGAKNDGIDIGIIAGAAGGGGLLLIIIIVVIVIIIRKRGPGNKQPFDPGNRSHDNTNGALSDDIQPYATTSLNNRYVTNDGDTLTHNSLYVSAGPRDPDTNYIIAGTGDMYAQVQKPEKGSTVDATDTDKLELEEQPRGDVYAVVNKPEKQNKNNETDDNRPSRYKNPDGLVYAEVGVQDMTSRPKSRVTSRPPPVSPKPKTDNDNVIYAEVNSSV